MKKYTQTSRKSFSFCRKLFVQYLLSSKKVTHIQGKISLSFPQTMVFFKDVFSNKRNRRIANLFFNIFFLLFALFVMFGKFDKIFN